MEGRSDPGITASIENYLKAVYRLEQDGLPGETNRLSEILGGIKPASVTAMVKKLADMGLVEYVPYQGVKLTPAGRRVSLKVLRRHRLIELYLVEHLGYSWDEVHLEAEQLEHYVSDKMVERIAAKLGDPEFDPHGDPIPGLDGNVPARETVSLADCPPGRRMQVFRVLDQNTGVLQFLSGKGLTLGAEILVESRDGFSGTIEVLIGTTRVTLERTSAARILVVPCPVRA